MVNNGNKGILGLQVPFFLIYDLWKKHLKHVSQDHHFQAVRNKNMLIHSITSLQNKEAETHLVLTKPVGMCQ